MTFQEERNLVWWYIPVTPSLERQRQEDCKFEASLGYTART
jgi:hypothetical protein